MVNPVPGNETPVVVRLVVVHVHAVAVHLLAEAVTGAVQDVILEARLDQHLRAPRVHLPAAQVAAGADAVADEGGRASRRRERGPGAWHGRRNVGPVKPIQVMSANTAPGVASLPQRSSSSTSFGPMPVRGCGREVVRVAGVLLGRDDRALSLTRPSSECLTIWRCTSSSVSGRPAPSASRTNANARP